jgi:hypothetical protein
MLSESKRVALDTSLYQNFPGEVVVATDIASLAIEARGSEKKIDSQRIWWFDHLPDKLSVTKPDFPSSVASLEIEQLIKTTPEKNQRLIMLVSPAYNFPEARMDLYFVHNSENHLSIDAYGIPIRESPQETEHRLLQFTPRSDTPNIPPLVGFDAVMTPLSVTMDQHEDIFDTAKLWINLPDNIWEQISSGEIKEKCRQLTCDMIPVAIALQGEIEQGREFHRAGARTETRMAEISGTYMDFSGSGCGISNFEVIYDHSSGSAHGSELAIFVNHCGRCCGSIRSYMKPGDHCPHCQAEFPKKSLPIKIKTLQQSLENRDPEAKTKEVQAQTIPVASWSWLSDWWRTLSVAA